MNNDLEQYAKNSFTDSELEFMAHGNNPVANAYRELLAFRGAAKQAKPFKYFIHVMDDGVLIMKSIPDDSPLVKIAMPLYTTPQPAHTEQDGYWYEVECYKYKGPAKLCAGNDGPAWFFPGSDLLVDNDEVKVIGRAAAPKPESEL